MITCSLCPKQATLLVKAHAAPFELPYCPEHAEKEIATLNKRKEGHTIHHIAEAPTPEEKLRAEVSRLQTLNTEQLAELRELRAEVAKLAPLKDQHRELVSLRAEVVRLTPAEKK